MDLAMAVRRAAIVRTEPATADPAHIRQVRAHQISMEVLLGMVAAPAKRLTGLTAFTGHQL